MMMDVIRKDMFEAKKVKDTIKANLLSTLFSEIFTLSKSGKDISADDEIKIIRKFMKNIDETLALDIPAGTRQKLEAEKNILTAYLPEQLSIDEIEKITAEMVSSGKTMKEIMPYFKEHFSGRYDGKTVSEIVKKISG